MRSCSSARAPRMRASSASMSNPICILARKPSITCKNTRSMRNARALAHASAGTQATACDSSSSPRSPRPLLVLGSAHCSPKKLSCLLLKRMVYCASCLRATTYRLIDMGFGFWEGTGLIVFLEDRGLACFRMRGPDCFSRNRPPCQGEPVSERVSCQGVPCQGGPVSERVPCQGGPVLERVPYQNVLSLLRPSKGSSPNLRKPGEAISAHFLRNPSF